MKLNLRNKFSDVKRINVDVSRCLFTIFLLDLAKYICAAVQNRFQGFRQQYYRRSCSQVFFKIGVFENFAIITGKHLCQSLFLINLQAFLSKRKRLHEESLQNTSGGCSCYQVAFYNCIQQEQTNICKCSRLCYCAKGFIYFDFILYV